MDWITTPGQRIDGIHASLAAAKPRPCGECECDCPLLVTWRELTDHLLDRLLEEVALAQKLETRR